MTCITLPAYRGRRRCRHQFSPISGYPEPHYDHFVQILTTAPPATSAERPTPTDHAMTTTETITPKTPDSDAAVDTALDVRSVAELITQILHGLHRVNGHFVHTNATLGAGGIITVKATRVYCGGEDATVNIQPVG